MNCACIPHFLSLIGLGSRRFNGISSLRQIECTGTALRTDVKLIALKLFRLADNHLLASMNVFDGTCLSFGAYAACEVRMTNTKKSSLRILDLGLQPGRQVKYGCNVSTIDARGYSSFQTWTTEVRYNSE